MTQWCERIKVSPGMVRLTGVGMLLLSLGQAQAVAAQTGAESSSRERIALVLGGGGARGAAHIGVLEVLARERVPVDCVVGTSMGALVAGAYAAGLTAEEMTAKLDEADWQDMFVDRADYSQLAYRTKKINKDLLAGTEIGLSKDGGATYQSGVVAGEKIKLFFNYLVGDHQGQRLIEDSALPLAIVATDIGTGERVVLREGSLTRAMRASMSVPGILAPVPIDKHKLVDGGLVDNLPVQLGRELCNATRVIAVNVGSKLRPAAEVNSLVAVTAQMIGILTDQNVHRSLALLGARDIYIEPPLDGIGAMDFARHKQAAAVGRDAALAQRAALQALSLSPESFAAHQASLRADRDPITAINHIEITGADLVPAAYTRNFIRQSLDQAVDRDLLDDDLIRLYGSGNFEMVDYRVHRDEGVPTLSILPQERAWTGDSVLFGFSLVDEYRDDAQINLRGAYRKNWINPYGGEFFALFDIGTEPYLEVEFYQPLNVDQTYFIEPRVVYDRDEINLYEGSAKVAEYTLTTAYGELMLGRNIGLWGQARVGRREYRFEARADFNPFALSSVDRDYGGYMARVVFDSRDRLHFPSDGWRGDVSYFHADEGYAKFASSLGMARPLGDFVLGVFGEYTTAAQDLLPVYDAARVGGFLNLSGYATHQIIANDIAYGHLRLEKIIGRMPLGFTGDMRMGIALEAARVRDAYTLADADTHLKSAALFLGGETPFGPVFIGYGNSLEGDHNVYFQIGPLDRFKF